LAGLQIREAQAKYEQAKVIRAQAKASAAELAEFPPGPSTPMNELEIPGLSLAFIDLAQAKGALPADTMQALCLALGSLIVQTSKERSTENVLRACTEAITEIVRKHTS
jgi:hypothetical protein